MQHCWCDQRSSNRDLMSFPLRYDYQVHVACQLSLQPPTTRISTHVTAHDLWRMVCVVTCLYLSPSLHQEFTKVKVRVRGGVGCLNLITERWFGEHAIVEVNDSKTRWGGGPTQTLSNRQTTPRTSSAPQLNPWRPEEGVGVPTWEVNLMISV